MSLATFLRPQQHDDHAGSVDKPYSSKSSFSSSSSLADARDDVLDASDPSSLSKSPPAHLPRADSADSKRSDSSQPPANFIPVLMVNNQASAPAIEPSTQAPEPAINDKEESAKKSDNLQQSESTGESDTPGHSQTASASEGFASASTNGNTPPSPTSNGDSAEPGTDATNGQQDQKPLDPEARRYSEGSDAPSTSSAPGWRASYESSNHVQSVQVNQTPFIQKLYAMLEDSNLSHVITWGENNDTFLVNPNEQFSNLLCLYFKHTNISSFVRQLSMYGFQKVSSQQTKKPNFSWEFRHMDGTFIRGDFAAMRTIKRRLSRPNHTRRVKYVAVREQPPVSQDIPRRVPVLPSLRPQQRMMAPYPTFGGIMEPVPVGQFPNQTAQYPMNHGLATLSSVAPSPTGSHARTHEGHPLGVTSGSSRAPSRAPAYTGLENLHNANTGEVINRIHHLHRHIQLQVSNVYEMVNQVSYSQAELNHLIEYLSKMHAERPILPPVGSAAYSSSGSENAGDPRSGNFQRQVNEQDMTSRVPPPMAPVGDSVQEGTNAGPEDGYPQDRMKIRSLFG